MRFLYMPKITPDVEADAQAALVEHIRALGFGNRIMLIPNGTQLPGDAKHRAMYSNFLKKQGLLPGASDLFFAWPMHGYHGAFFEMKRLKGGRVSPDQLAFTMNMRTYGYWADVCSGLAEGVDSFQRYMQDGEWLWCP
jgi:hypothetical protein